MKPKSRRNLAKDVETKLPPNQKLVDIPNVAKVKIGNMSNALNDYISGVVAGLGITGKWSFDMRTMRIIVTEIKKDTKDKEKVDDKKT